MKTIFKGSQTAGNIFLKPAVNVAAPFRGMVFSAKTKNPNVDRLLRIVWRVYQEVNFWL